MKSPKNDPQRERAYSWEGSLYDWSPAREADEALTGTIARACRMYRVPPPTVKFTGDIRHKGVRLSSHYDPNDHSITLRRRHRNLNTAIHEAAHAITDWILGPFSTKAHGKEWLGVFMVLLEKFKLSPRSALVASATADRLKFEPFERVNPRAIRKTFVKLAAEASRNR